MENLNLKLNTINKTATPYTKVNNKLTPCSLNSAVIIPALNPMENLVHFVLQIIKSGIPQVIVVNDGSDSSYTNIFETLKKIEGCSVLTHDKNYGKGHALKTAFKFVLNKFSYLDGVVTADADGQHTIEDICSICKVLASKEASIVLGVRNFKESNVPKRSYIGNVMTSKLFFMLYGIYINDTQTGLRGIHTSELSWLISTKGERYDYEINMLINAKHRDLNFITIPIKTIYYDNNSGSHYNTIKDSTRIFMRLLSGFIKYSGSSVISGIVDISSFFIMNTFLFAKMLVYVKIFSSTAIARLLSSACNFSINSRLIFKVNKNRSKALLRYYVLCSTQMLASFGLVYGISLLWNVNEAFIKLFVDFCLGLISYQVQLHWVFNIK